MADVPTRMGAEPGNGDGIRILHGEWIDADQSADEIHEAVQRVLAASSQPGAEEWAIHDLEDFDELRLSEYESSDRVAAIAEHGEVFTARLSYDNDPVDTSAFEDAYCGEWGSLRAYAEDFAERARDDRSTHIVPDFDTLRTWRADETTSS